MKYKKSIGIVMVKNGRWTKVVVLNACFGTLMVILDHSLLSPSSVIIICLSFVLFAPAVVAAIIAVKCFAPVHVVLHSDSQA